MTEDQRQEEKASRWRAEAIEKFGEDFLIWFRSFRSHRLYWELKTGTLQGSEDSAYSILMALGEAFKAGRAKSNG